MYKPREGDYVVVKTNGVAAKLIRLGTLSRWNHAAIIVGFHEGETLIAEARPTGVTISYLSQYSTYAFNQHEELTPAQRVAIVTHAYKQVGKPYAFTDILILALRNLGLKLPPKNFWIKLAKGKGYICSELVAESYRKAGLSVLDKEDCFITPGDLAERLIYQ